MFILFIIYDLPFLKTKIERFLKNMRFSSEFTNNELKDLSKNKKSHATVTEIKMKHISSLRMSKHQGIIQTQYLIRKGSFLGDF